MKNWTPGEWTIFFGAVATILGTLTTSIIAILNASRANTKSDTNTSNMQALGAGVMATGKAINQTTNTSTPNVPQAVIEAARQIRNDPTTAVETPQHTDPERQP